MKLLALQVILNLLNVPIMEVGCDVMHKMLAYVAAFAP